MPGALVRFRSRRASAGNRPRRILRSAVEQSKSSGPRASRHAVWMWIARAWCGPCSRADSLQASIVRSVRGLSSGPAANGPALPRRMDALSVARARITKAPLKVPARIPPTTISSIGSTCSASAKTSRRDRQPVGRIARAGRRQVRDVPRAISDGLLRRRGSTAASTTRTAAGKGRGSSPRCRRARRSTSKAARARRRNS